MLRSKCTVLEGRLGKLECASTRKGLPEPDASMHNNQRLNRLRLETSLDAFSHCTQQLHQQVEILKSHKRQLGHLPTSEVTSLELSLSLLERCLHHLRSGEEQASRPMSPQGSSSHRPPQGPSHQTSSDVRQAFNVGAGIICQSSSSHCRTSDLLQPSSVLNGERSSLQAMEMNARNLNHNMCTGSRPGSTESRENMFHLSPMSNIHDYDEDQSWLEYDSSYDGNATMAAKIKSLVANPKWGRLHYRNGATELTRSLAHILYTKEELILSTVTGRNGFEALDNVKLMAIREAVEKKYGHSGSDFEQLWKQCVTSLGQHCKYLRQKSGLSHSPQLVVSHGRYRQESPEQKPIITEEKDLQHIIVADLE
ncbi:uncharacterized protein [Apostichopus japonicus]|uniref:uncharacterized protein isoform X3 n=1 Tax=Stichopus japonicus TaxID=307972 RepID=UPI003AB513BA